MGRDVNNNLQLICLQLPYKLQHQNMSKNIIENLKMLILFFHFSEDDGDNEEPESESESESVDEEEIFAMLEKDVHAKPNEEDLPVEHHENIRVSP